MGETEDEKTSAPDFNIGEERADTFSTPAFVVPPADHFSKKKVIKKKLSTISFKWKTFFDKFRWQNIKKKPRNRLKLIYWVVALAVFIFISVLAQNYLVYRTEVARFDRSITALKFIINGSDLQKESNIGEAVKSIKELERATYKLKLISESTGQSSSLFGVLNVHPSKVSTKLILLDSLYQLFSIKNEINFDAYQAAIGDLASGYLVDANAMQSLLAADLGKALNSIDKIKAGLGNNTDSESQDFLRYLDIGKAKIVDAQGLIGEDLAPLFAKDAKKNILVIFQNNSELRGGSGGSFGSFGIMKINNGKIEKIDFGQNIYKIDNAYRASDKPVIPASDELKFVIPERLVLKDAGWAVDGEEAFQNIEKFYNIETGETVDGVMTFDYSAFVSLLKVLGPIEMKDYKVTLTADNFKSIVEDEVHNTYFESDANKAENEPKKILSDLMPIAFERIFSYKNDPEKLVDVLGSFYSSLKNKNILLYFDDKNLEKKVKEGNFGGTVNPTLADYLYINNSNIDGAKSSLSVAQNVDLKVSINGTGSIQNSLSITRKHNGLNVFPDGLNKNFIRLLLPLNSQVTSFSSVAGNFEQFNDRGYKNGWKYWLGKEKEKTTVNFWMNTMAQTQSAVDINYKSGYKVTPTAEGFTYEIALQRQPGALPDNVTFSLNYPKGYQPTNVENYDIVNNILMLKFDLTTDKTIKINFEAVK